MNYNEFEERYLTHPDNLPDYMTADDFEDRDEQMAEWQAMVMEERIWEW